MSSWTDDVIRERAVCECHPDKTWLRHVPTQVLMWHHGRGEEETLAHLADLLHALGKITQEDRDAAHAAAREATA